MDKIIQLPLPLVWWSDVDKWRIRHTVDNVSRPTEDAALDNVYYAARLKSGLRLGESLSALEQHIYKLECQVKVMPAYAYTTPFARAGWIHEQLQKKWSRWHGHVAGVWHIMSILDDISYAMRGYAQHEALLEREWEYDVVKDVVIEFTTEWVARAA